MNRSKLSPSSEYIGLVVLLVVIGVVGRLAPHWPNFTPLGALVVWSGMRLGFKQGALVVLGSLLATDIFIGFSNQSMLVYAGLLMGVGIASLAKRVSVVSVGVFTLINTAVFYLITNNNFLYPFALYPKSWAGMITSYEAGLPFLRASLAGDLFYVALFFGLEAVVVKVVQARQKLVTQ